MSERLLLCTDLDRTLIPNGPQPESPSARDYFRRLCASGQLVLVYVSGRHRSLVEEAIADYQLPLPDYVVGDVGTTIYRVGRARQWQRFAAWERLIGGDWAGREGTELAPLFADLDTLRLQEQSKQNRYKLSYYLPLHAPHAELDAEMKRRLHSADVNATLVWSVDEASGVGLLDVLPAAAGKLHAVEFLMKSLGFTRDNTVFSGDSGNDMPVLVSSIPAVLVNNATPEVRAQATAICNQQRTGEALYLAKGGYLQMNGNYSAGILEGLAHYHPHWMERNLAGIKP
jgi:HAD superfamily hydrolase (TIGR01484 family)